MIKGKIRLPSFKKRQVAETNKPKQQKENKQNKGQQANKRKGLVTKLAFKLYFSYALILIFLLLVGGASLLFISEMGKTSQELYEERFQYVSNMLSLTHDFEQLNGAVAANLLQVNAIEGLDYIESLEENIQRRIQELEDNFINYGITEDELRSFKLIWGSYVNGLISVKDWMRESAKDSNLGMGMAIGTFNTQLKIRIATLNEYLDSWVALNSQLAEESYQASISTQESLRYVQIQIIIAAIIVSLIVGTFIARHITRPLHMVTVAADKMAQGELNQSINVNRKDEIGQLAVAFNRMSANISELIKKVKWTGEQVASSAQLLSSNMNQMNETSEQIAVTIHEVAEGSSRQADHANQVLSKMETTMDSVGEGFKLVDASLEKATKSTSVAYEGEKAINEAIDHLQLVTKSVSETTESIHKLGKLSENIGSIIHVITDISNQTNLLALNAAIEAARAGEHGKGFAVVADEVRKLAEQSNESAQQIINLVGEIQQETTNSIQSMENSNQAVQAQVEIIQKGGTALAEIIKTVEETEGGAKQIQVSFTEIKENIEDVLQAVQEISSIIEESAAATEEVASGAQEQSATANKITSNTIELAKMAESLEQEVQKFRI